MIRLDFKSIEPSADFAGTSGTTCIHAGFAAPPAEEKVGTTGDIGMGDENLSPMSPVCPHSLGVGKPAINLVVPKVPLAPTKKLSSELKIRPESIRLALGPFQLDLVEAEIAAGYPAQKLHRVNNMAWEFMLADGISFDEAIHVASAIVESCPLAQCEASYVDVLTLWIQGPRN